ncbi:MAG: MTH938/NDUFAF3 family protein [Thermodesulfobacteriota bacterium]
MTKIGAATKLILAMAAVLTCLLPAELLAEGYLVEHYEFGKVIVSGQVYEHDIVIMPDGAIQSGPEDMHYVLLPELEKVINTPDIKVLVIGTGADGNGLLRKKLIKVVKARGIKLEMMLTRVP